MPPAVSAIKVDGQRAYRLTRNGAAPELKPRPVTVYEFTVTAVRPAGDGDLLDVDATVRCSSGTYIRALARDLGTELGTGGHLVRLRRTWVGGYGLGAARTLEQLAERFEVMPLAEAAAAAFPRRDLSADEARRLAHGARLPASRGNRRKADRRLRPGWHPGRAAHRAAGPGTPAGGFRLRLGWWSPPTKRRRRNGIVYRWYGLDDVPADWGASVATIGVFDGVHRGHQRVVERAVETAQERDLPVVVITFDPHPDEVVRPGPHPPSLTSERRLAQLLAGLGADALLVLPFTVEFSRLSPDEFVRIVLSDRLHAAAVVVGEDFRFGHKAAGDVPLLAQLGEKYDFTAEGVPLLVADGVTMSSTSIRERLAAGDVAGAAALLGRPHRVEGVVVRGHLRGRALGFPTANLEIPPHMAIPADGVYAGWLARLDLDGDEAERWPAAISVGTNPTFGGTDRTVEAYALDRDDLDLYGTHAAIEFTARLRGTEKFDSVEALVVQMRMDVEAARALTAG